MQHTVQEDDVKVTVNIERPTREQGSMRPMEVFILLDRTGSMATRWNEAVTSVNQYPEELKKQGVSEDDYITLAVFDGWDGIRYDVLRSSKLRNWVPITNTEVTPRGNTPLYDAMQRIIARAESRGADKTVVVVMTDGEENASRETTREALRASVERIKARGWQIVYLGMNFDGFKQASLIGIPFQGTMAVADWGLNQAATSTATATAAYRSTGKSIGYSQADRNASGEDTVVKKDDNTGK